MNVITPTSQQVFAAGELDKVSNEFIGFRVDAGFLDAPSTEECAQCGEGPGICFVLDDEVDLSAVPDQDNPGETLGVFRVCNPLCVPCCVYTAEAASAPDFVLSIDIATWTE